MGLLPVVRANFDSVNEELATAAAAVETVVEVLRELGYEPLG